MAGAVKWQAGSLYTFSGTALASSLTSGSAGLAGTLDCSASGTAATADMLIALFSLTAQWATTTNITSTTTLADLYLVPVIDGTNSPDIDATPGASIIPYQHRVGSFPSPKASLSAATNYLLQSGVVELAPALYNVYILNKSGQTISANWAVKALAAAVQYT